MYSLNDMPNITINDTTKLYSWNNSIKIGNGNDIIKGTVVLDLNKDGKKEFFGSDQNFYDGCIHVSREYYKNNGTWAPLSSCIGNQYSEDFWISMSHGNYSGNYSIIIEDWGTDDEGELLELYWDNGYKFRKLKKPKEGTWFGRPDFIFSNTDDHISCDLDGDGHDEIGVSTEKGSIYKKGGLFVLDWNFSKGDYDIYTLLSFQNDFGYYSGSCMDRNNDNKDEYYIIRRNYGNLTVVYFENGEFKYETYDNTLDHNAGMLSCGNVSGLGNACYVATIDPNSSQVVQYLWTGTDFEEKIIGELPSSYVYAITVGDVDYDGLDELLIGTLEDNKTIYMLEDEDRDGNWTMTPILDSTIESVGDIGVFDADNDGINEIYFSSYGSGPIGSYYGMLKYTNQSEGLNKITVYAIDDEGNIASDTVYYVINRSYSGIELSERPLIITNTPFFGPPDIPTLFQYNSTSSPYIERFIENYNPDRIYTIDFLSALPNSVRVTLSEAPFVFYPNTTEAVLYPSNETLAIFASEFASYLGLPLIFPGYNEFEISRYDHIYNFSNSSVKDIQDLYIEKVLENGDNIDCIVLVNPNHESSMLAGRYAGRNNCYIVPVYDTSFGGIQKVLNETAHALFEKNLFSASDYYRFARPLYVVMFGGNESIPYATFPDMGNEIFFDKDGNTLYNDMKYGTFKQWSLSDFAFGRFTGTNEDISLQLSSGFLNKTNETVILSEYGINSRLDFLAFGGGMLQGLVADYYIRSKIPVTRIVEQRTENISTREDVENLLKKIKKYLSKMSQQGTGKLAKLSSAAGLIYTVLELGDLFMYPVFEFDWFDLIDDVFNLNIREPRHLPVLNETNIKLIKKQKLAAYFGVEENGYWLLPNHYMDEWGMLLWPYTNPLKDRIYVKSLNYSGFLYNDHDMSAIGRVTESVLRSGGSLVTSSGVSHLIFNAYPSNAFFRSIAKGASVGEALLNAYNYNPESVIFVHLLMSPPISMNPLTLNNLGAYIKSKEERILLGDPKQRLVEGEEYYFEYPQYFVLPFYSFLAVQNVTTNYTINGSYIFFTDEDSGLAALEKPYVPLYVRDFYLPKGAKVNYINFTPSYSVYEDVSTFTIYNNSHYTNHTKIIYDCMDMLGLAVGDSLSEEEKTLLSACIYNALRPSVDYPYPNITYWAENHTLLDGRILLRVFVPAMLFENESHAKVLENAAIYVDYDTPSEMNIRGNDITIFDDAIIEATIFNDGDDELTGTVSVMLDSEIKKANVTVRSHSNETVDFNFGKKEGGTYEAVSAFSGDGISIGPRYAHITVYGFPFFNSTLPENITINEGEDKTVGFEMEEIAALPSSGFSFDISNLSSGGNAIGKGNISLGVESSGNVYDVHMHISVPDMQPPGAYEGAFTVAWEGHELFSRNFDVIVPKRAVPEINPASWFMEGVPGDAFSETFTLKNMGNVPLDVVSVEPQSWDAGSIDDIMPGESSDIIFTKMLPYTAPGLYEENIIFNFGDYAEPASIDIPVEMNILPVVYWDMENGIWEINYGEDPMKKEVQVSNSNESNVPISHLDADVSGIAIDAFANVDDQIIPGETGNVEIILDDTNGIPNGTSYGVVNVSGENYFVPSNYEIPLVIHADGPVVDIERKFVPRMLYNLWGKFLLPQTAYPEMLVRSKGIDVRGFELHERVPEGWVAKGYLYVLYAKKIGRKIVPLSVLMKKRINEEDELAIRIKNLRKTALRRPLRKGEYLIIRYHLKTKERLPETVIESSLRVFGENNVYSDYESDANIPVKYIGSIFGFF
ncbi:MAG: hypothetical protein GXO64_02970 [Candidatus Micrarchaeota archaeon]|nr:hypothetical protein [Candidatus Micrarchaeota archaeon]